MNETLEFPWVELPVKSTLPALLVSVFSPIFDCAYFQIGDRTVNIEATGNSDPMFSFAGPPMVRRLRQGRQAPWRNSTPDLPVETIEHLNSYGIPYRNQRSIRVKRQTQQCADRTFRDAAGRCNNLNNPTWGQSFQPYVRFLPPDYADGVSVPRIRAARSRNALPSPRQVTVVMHQALNRPHDHITHIVSERPGPL